MRRNDDGILCLGLSLSSRALLGGVSSPNAFSPLKAKLVAGQNVVIFVNADSTGYTDNAPFVLFNKQLAASVSGTSSILLWDEWNVSAATGTKAYRAAVTTVYGAGPTVTMYLAATPGQVSGYLWDGSRKANALDGIPTPDVCILHHGHNMANFDTQSGLGFYTGVGLLHATIGMTSLQWPGTPQIMTTQNPDGRDTAMNNIYSAYNLAALALPSLTKIDTYADFIAVAKASNYYRGIVPDPPGVHPSDAAGAGNFDGGQLQADRLWSTYRAAKATSLFNTVSWPATAGSNLLTNGDFASFTGAFPLRCGNAGTTVTAAKDTIIKYGAAAYSCAVTGATMNDLMSYGLSSAERTAAVAAGIVSVGILYYQPSTQPRPFFNFLVKDAGNTLRGWVQGDLINCFDGWYLACISGVPVGSGAAADANTSIRVYPRFSSGTFTDALRVQKIMMVAGSLPSGLFP